MSTTRISFHQYRISDKTVQLSLVIKPLLHSALRRECPMT